MPKKVSTSQSKEIFTVYVSTAVYCILVLYKEEYIVKMRFSKKVLSFILSILMIVSSVPAFAVTTQAAELNRDPSLNKFLYAYFCGNQGCQLRFAVSDDGYNFEALNSGDVIATAEADEIITFPGAEGKGATMGNQKGIRDPYIIKKPNAAGYYIIATDLDTSYGKHPNGKDNTYNNTNILIWDVDSIEQIGSAKPWSVDTSGWFPQYYGVDDRTNILVWNRTENYVNYNGIHRNFCAWAPEVIWDADMGMYMMYWSAAMYDDLRIHYAYTRDFKTFYHKDGTTILDGVNEYNGSVNPEILYDPGYTSIDGDITYDTATNKYYMYYKDENAVRNGQAQSNTIHRVESNSCSGPYTNDVIVDSSNTGLEGPEVYQLNNGNYVLMGDNFANSTDGGRFFLYENDSIEGLLGGTSQFIGNKCAINHLMPSHGAVTYITTEEYNTLIDTYGVSNFVSPSLDNPKTVNSHLVARYFTTDGVTHDATGHGYDLSIANNLTVESDDKYSNYALFKGNGILTTNYSQGSYGVVDTTKMLNDYNFNATDGVTFSWYAKPTQTGEGYGAFYTQVQAGVNPGALTYDGKTLSHYNTYHSYLYANNAFSAAGAGVGDAVYEYDNVTTYNGWNEYTVTYIGGFMNVFVNGKLLNKIVASNGAVINGCPLAVSSINNDWFKNIFTGNLYFGATAFGGQDKMYDGAIADFRIYNKALNTDEIKTSNKLFNADKIAQAVETYEDEMAKLDHTCVKYAPAYKAYIDCKRAYDALTYGTKSNGAENDEIDYDALVDTLSDRMNESTQFYSPDGINVTAAGNKDNKTIDSQYANKLVYYGGSLRYNDDERSNGDIVGCIATFDSKSGIGGYSVYLYHRILMSDFVMLYDGDDTNLPTAPVQYAFSYYCSSNGKTRGMTKVMCDNPEFRLATWHESTSSWIDSKDRNIQNTQSSAYNYGDPKYKLSSGNDEGVGGISTGSKNTNNTRWTGNSYLTLNPANVTFKNDGTAAKINTSFEIYNIDNKSMGHISAADITTTSQSNHTMNPDYSGHFNTCYGYVLDYRPVKEAQAAAMKYINSVKDYQVDNKKMLALLEAVDSSTKINLQGCFGSNISTEDGANTAQKLINDAAKAINDAIDALGTVPPVDHYDDLRDIIPKAQIIASSSNTKYTAESYAQFKKMFDDAQAFMSNVYGNNFKDYYDEGINNYNYNEHAKVIAEALENVLNELMDVTELRTELKARAAIYDSTGKQVSTLSSWLANYDKITQGQTDLVNLGKAPKYPTTKATYTTIDGTVVEYDKVDKNSTNEGQIDDAVAAVKTIELQPVDAAEAYDNFDNVCAVVSAMDRAKYTDESLAEIDALYKKLNTEVVYMTPSQNATSLYKSINNVDISGRKLLNTTTDLTDPESIRLLELVNGADVNKYNSYLSVKTSTGDTKFETIQTDVPYGEMFTIDVSDKMESGDKVTWSATLYKKGDGAKAVNGEVVEPIGTQKISNYTGSQMLRKADCDIVVTAKISKSTASETGKTVYIYNGYKNILDVVYVNSAADVIISAANLTVDGKNYSPRLPFYSLTGWEMSESGNDIFVTPVYNEVDLRTIVVNGGTAEGLNGDKAAVTNFVTLKADDANAYGWAVKNNGKYQIVGYGNEYSFVVVNDEEYYPIIKSGYNYTVDGQNLTADLVDGFQNNTADVNFNDDQYLKIKLNNKAPFVYSQSVSGNTHYFRITANCDESILKAHGMHVTKPDGVSKAFASTALNVAGQYSMTMKNDTTGYSFNGYVTYEFEYVFKGVSYSINTTEYCE